MHRTTHHRIQFTVNQSITGNAERIGSTKTHHDEVGDDDEEPRGPKRAPRQGAEEVCGGEARGGEAGEEHR
jgi:hypothetical protein